MRVPRYYDSFTAPRLAQILAMAALVAASLSAPRVVAQTCTPLTCVSFPAGTCGQQDNGCSGLTANCGTCTPPSSCGGGGTPNICGVGVCQPTSCVAENKNCGSIATGCGGTQACGSCTPPATCGGTGIQNVCGTDPIFKDNFEPSA